MSFKHVLEEIWRKENALMKQIYFKIFLKAGLKDGNI